MQPLEAGEPHTIGAYRLLGRLGAGGMGRVYLGRSAGGRTVAVKVVHPHFALDEQFRARFRREVESARRIGAQWTAPVLDADPDAPVPWVATGYVAGPPLSQAITEHGPLPEHAVRTLGAGLAEALHVVHGQGIVHRDVKPSNVLLALDGPRLIDFGIARALGATVSLTSTGVSVGARPPADMAPARSTMTAGAGDVPSGVRRPVSRVGRRRGVESSAAEGVAGRRRAAGHRAASRPGPRSAPYSPSCQALVPTRHARDLGDLGRQGAAHVPGPGSGAGCRRLAAATGAASAAPARCGTGAIGRRGAVPGQPDREPDRRERCGPPHARREPGPCGAAARPADVRGGLVVRHGPGRGGRFAPGAGDGASVVPDGLRGRDRRPRVRPVRCGRGGGPRRCRGRGRGGGGRHAGYGLRRIGGGARRGPGGGRGPARAG
ncbi:Serine/threonine-protein kinase PknD [Streptomyces microflavus]